MSEGKGEWKLIDEGEGNEREVITLVCVRARMCARVVGTMVIARRSTNKEKSLIKSVKEGEGRKVIRGKRRGKWKEEGLGIPG